MIFSVFILLGLIIISCDVSGDSTSNDTYGSLQIITPVEWNPDIVSLQIIGEGPSGRNFDLTFPFSPSPIYISNIITGPWTIFVFALNADADQVLAGQQSILIEQGMTKEISINLSPLEGIGTLVIEFTWPVGAISNPVVSAFLSPYLEDDIFGVPVELLPFEYSEVEGMVVYRYEGVHEAGYYLLETQIRDDSGTPWSKSDALIITAGNEVPVTIDLETGAVNIQIILDGLDPLEVTLTSDSDSPLPLGEEMTVTSTVTGGTPPYTYRWYLNGEHLEAETGDSVVVGSTLSAGRYRLTLIASDGDVLGSEGLVIDIMP